MARIQKYGAGVAAHAAVPLTVVNGEESDGTAKNTETELNMRILSIITSQET